ncbi:MAG: serine/threonine-protein kinase, partial [Thermoanaerobaculia bacterium]
MSSDRIDRVKEVFEVARQRSHEDRERYLDEVCSDDKDLRREVESLLLESGRLTMTREDTNLLDDSFRAGDLGMSAGGTEGRPESIGRYRIVSLLGEGGMGRVYEAEDPELKRRVALKVLTPKLATDAKFLSRFKLEAQTVAALSHPNVVTLYSVEESEGTHFLTMELVRGEPLHHLIPEGGFDLKELLDLAIPMVEGLRAAHEQGIVHRDLKPGNVMVDTDGRVRILDFGLAKQHTADSTDSQEETMTALGAIVGTVPYMSPEQVSGQGVDQRSDLFSLGVILHEMCLGTRPFRGETATHTMSAILRDRPALVSEIRQDLPEHLGRIIRRCLEKEPAKRYQTARVVKEELEQLKQEVESGSTLNLAPPRLQKSGAVKWLVLAGAVVLLSAVGYLMFSQGSITSTLEETGAQSRASAETPVKLIAVLPLRNLGPAEDEYFAVGITEEIISRLAMIPG